MTPPRRSRRWIVFFAVLALLALAAVAVETWYNLQQQLTPARVEQARVLWREKGRPSYDLRYTVKRQTRGGDRLLARVRGGDVTAVEADGAALDPAEYPFYDLPGLLAKVEASPAGDHAGQERTVDWSSPATSTVTYAVAVRGGEVVRAESDGQPLPAPLRQSYDMPALLAGVGRLLERDARAGAVRTYNVASFDAGDGRLIHYVRSSMRTRERVEFILVRFDPVAETGLAP